MATQKEIKEICTELNLKPSDFERFWNECIEIGHKLICQFKNSGLTWQKLNTHLIRGLPTAKEKCLETRVKESELAKQKEFEQQEAKRVADNYEKNFENIIVSKIDNDEELSEEELERIADSYFVDEIEGDDNRWSRNMETIVKLNNRLFSIYWQKGLTEYQDNNYSDQPIEVEKVVKIKTIEEVSYIKKVK